MAQWCLLTVRPLSGMHSSHANRRGRRALLQRLRALTGEKEHTHAHTQSEREEEGRKGDQRKGERAAIRARQRLRMASGSSDWKRPLEAANRASRQPLRKEKRVRLAKKAVRWGGGRWLKLRKNEKSLQRAIKYIRRKGKEIQRGGIEERTMQG